MDRILLPPKRILEIEGESESVQVLATQKEGAGCVPSKSSSRAFFGFF
jgi:hypothetical protein